MPSNIKNKCDKVGLENKNHLQLTNSIGVGIGKKLSEAKRTGSSLAPGNGDKNCTSRELLFCASAVG